MCVCVCVDISAPPRRRKRAANREAENLFLGERARRMSKRRAVGGVGRDVDDSRGRHDRTIAADGSARAALACHQRAACVHCTLTQKCVCSVCDTSHFNYCACPREYVSDTALFRVQGGLPVVGSAARWNGTRIIASDGDDENDEHSRACLCFMHFNDP